MITSLRLEGKQRSGSVAYSIIFVVLFMIDGVNFVRQKG